jgi:hypothetical protein
MVKQIKKGLDDEESKPESSQLPLMESVNSQFLCEEDEAAITEQMIDTKSHASISTPGATPKETSGSAKANVPEQVSPQKKAHYSPALNVPKQAQKVISKPVVVRYPYTAMARERGILLKKDMLFHQLRKK